MRSSGWRWAARWIALVVSGGGGGGRVGGAVCGRIDGGDQREAGAVEAWLVTGAGFACFGDLGLGAQAGGDGGRDGAGGVGGADQGVNGVVLVDLVACVCADGAQH